MSDQEEYYPTHEEVQKEAERLLNMVVAAMDEHRKTLRGSSPWIKQWNIGSLIGIEAYTLATLLGIVLTPRDAKDGTVCGGPISPHDVLGAMVKYLKRTKYIHGAGHRK
jgi:hypothetical protein